jgi:hypothetical protein
VPPATPGRLRRPPPVRGRPLRVVLAVAVSAALLGAVLIISPDARRELALSLTRVEPGFTELYFGAGGVAATPAPGGGVRLRVDVVVAHRGTGEDRYTLRVEALDGRGAAVAQRVQGLTVPADERRGSYLSLDVPSGTTWSSVQVTLDGRPEIIHYAAPPAGEPEGP